MADWSSATIANQHARYLKKLARIACLILEPTAGELSPQRCFRSPQLVIINLKTDMKVEEKGEEDLKTSDLCPCTG